MQKLSRRQLNRTFLHRQHLLQRADLTPTAMIEHLVGLQSQIPNPPYIGLWTRLQAFQRDDLTSLLQNQTVVRAAMMRSTLHLVRAADHQQLQPILQPALDKALLAFFGKAARSLDTRPLVELARPFLNAEARSMGDLRTLLLGVFPDEDGPAMAYAVRNNLPLIQVPPSGTWGVGTRATYTTAESVLGPLTPADLKTLFKRCLAAFGPASTKDFQAWTGMTRLKTTIERWRNDFQLFTDENGLELFDLPDAKIVDENTPAPVRFVPEYDSLLVSHVDRTRIIADTDRKYVFLSAGRVLGTLLIDGFVAATWKTARDKSDATLTVSLFPHVQVDKDTTTSIAQEGDALLRFIEDDAEKYRVVIA